MTTININLLPEDMKAKPRGGGGGGGLGLPTVDSAAVMPIAIGIVAAIVVGATPSLANMLWLDPLDQQVQQDDADAQAEIDKFKSTLNDLKKIGDRKELLRQQLATLQNVAGASTSWADILNELRSITPANLWFDSMKTDVAKGTLSLAGGALDYSSVSYFHRNLDHSINFASPVLTKTEQSVTPGGIKVVKFEMNVLVRTQKKS